MTRGTTRAAPMPDRRQILDYIRDNPDRANRRDIARAFGIRGERRAELRGILKGLEAEGLLYRGTGQRLESPDTLPKVTVLEITGVDIDGEVMARPAEWRGAGRPPAIRVMPERRGHPAVGPGERVLARLHQRRDGEWEARVMKRLPRPPLTILGRFEALAGAGGRVRPTERKMRDEIAIPAGETGGAETGDLVMVEPLAAKPLGLRRGRVIERLGSIDAPRSISLIAIHSHGIPVEFDPQAVALAKAAKPPALAGRTDLRSIPLVTIDGADARDFDDAVWAGVDPDDPEGWHAIVAIADVAHYVRPGDALDRATRERGNSVYFPDRVVPMLPEALSEGLCSLKPGEDRACLAVHMRIGADGALREHRFERGLMRSAARLTYVEVQAARDGDRRAAGPAADLADTVIPRLYGVWRALDRARAARGALEIDRPEQEIVLDDDGQVARVGAKARVDSQRVIEELMIAANVAAAETLERLGQPCMYRIHESPDRAKVEALAKFLDGMGYRLARGQAMRPELFNKVLERAKGREEQFLVSELVLRCQSQAKYSPANLGHFGLALDRYAHFTSPIRRYSDLLVHRALIGGLWKAPDGMGPLSDAEGRAALAATGEHISATERRAMMAERDAKDRYLAAWLSERTGANFAGRVNGVTRFGLFVTLDESGADGLVPVRSLPRDWYVHDEERHRLVGRDSGREYRLGERVEVRLVEADPVSGSLILNLLDGGGGGGRSRRRGPAPSRRGRKKRR